MKKLYPIYSYVNSRVYLRENTIKLHRGWFGILKRRWIINGMFPHPLSYVTTVQKQYFDQTVLLPIHIYIYICAIYVCLIEYDLKFMVPLIILIINAVWNPTSCIITKQSQYFLPTYESFSPNSMSKIFIFLERGSSNLRYIILYRMRS